MMAGLDGRPTWRSSTVALPLLLLLLWLGVHEGAVQHSTAFGFGFLSRRFGRSNRQRAAPPSTVVEEPPMGEAPVWLVMRMKRRRFYHFVRRLSRPQFEFDETIPVEQYRVLRMNCYALKGSARRSNYEARLRSVSSCYDEAVKHARQNGSPSVPFYTYEVAEGDVPQLRDISLRDKIATAGEGMTDTNVAIDLGPQRVGNGAIFVRCQTRSGLDPSAWNCLGTKDGVPFRPALADQYVLWQDLTSLRDADDEEPHFGLPRSSANELSFLERRQVKTAGAASLHGNPAADTKVLRPFRYSTVGTSRKTRVVVVKLRDEWLMRHFSNGHPLYRKSVTKKRLPKGGTHVTLECYVGLNMSAIPGCFGCYWREAVQRVFPQQTNNREKTRIFITTRNPRYLAAFMYTHHNPKYNYVFEGTWQDDLLSGPDTAPDAPWPVLRAPLAASLWNNYIPVDARLTDISFFQRNEEGQEIKVASTSCAALFTAHFDSTWWELKEELPQQSIEAPTDEDQQEHFAAAEPSDGAGIWLDVSLTGSKISIGKSSTKLSNRWTFHITMKETARQEFLGDYKEIQPALAGCSLHFERDLFPLLVQREIIRIEVARSGAPSFRHTEIYRPPSKVA